MKHLCFPASCARLSEEEQCETIGGGDLRSAWSTFTDNLHFGDFSMGSGLLTFSISFVPMLLFNVVKTGFNFVVGAYDTISDLFHFSREEKELVEYLSDQQQRKQQAQNQTNGFLSGC